MKSNYRQLVQWMKEVDLRGSSILYVLNKKSLDKFVEDNLYLYETVKKEMEALSAQFMVTDPKTGNILTQGVGIDAKPVFKDGFTLEMYTVAFNDLMATECNIKL